MAHSVPLALLLVLLLLAGCVSTQPVALDTAEGRTRINDRAERGHPVVALDGERGRQVRALHVGPDVTTWIDRRTGDVRSAPTESVAVITFRRDGAGALKGAAVGVGIGVALGLLASATDDSRGLIEFSTGQTVGLFGANGVLIGALAGAIHSDRAVYRVEHGGLTGADQGAMRCGGAPLACATPPRRTVSR